MTWLKIVQKGAFDKSVGKLKAHWVAAEVTRLKFLNRQSAISNRQFHCGFRLDGHEGVR
jgi:hypothetical protein